MKSVEIGNRRELFWDLELINTNKTTATQRLHTPEKKEIVFKFDASFEGDGCNSYSILKIDNKYRLYYLARPISRDDYKTLDMGTFNYAFIESEDGINWTRPSLGIYEIDGSRDNNVVMTRDDFDFIDMVHIFIDTNPACPKEEKIKAISKGKDKWLHSFFSEDGIHFKNGPLLTNKAKLDTHNIAFFDEDSKQYFAFIRDIHNIPEGASANLGIRDISVMTSPDFRNWTTPKRVSFGNQEDYPLYTNEVQKYPRAPHMFYGLPTRYYERKVWTKNTDQLPNLEQRKKISNVEKRFGLAATDCVLITSRDGFNFHRFDDALITPGLEDNHNWYYGNCYPSTGFIETKNHIEGAASEYSFYMNENHWNGIPTEVRRYTTRKDGFASLFAGYDEKVVVTKPIKFSGTQMELNFSTSARGYVYVKIKCGNSVATSCEIFGNSISRIVPFDKDISKFQNKPCTIEFKICDADLYSYKFF